MTDILVYTEEQGNVIAGSVQPDRMTVAVLGAVGGGTGGGGAVSSVNGQIGHVVLDAADVGADPAGTGASAASAAVAAHEAALDPHPQYTTAAEAAAAAPVQSVNGETGVVVLSATDVGADVAGTAAAAVAAHVADTTPHDVITHVARFGFDTAAGQTAGVGEMVWNAADGTVDLGLPGGVTLQVGQEQLIRVLNKTGSTIQNMHVVYITGAQGNRVTAAQAQANSVNADKTLAVATQDIANNAEGFATTLGMVRQVNTSAWAEGTELWLSAATPGAITNVRPSAPNHQVRVGYVVRSHATQGVIYVTVNIGADLGHLHDVVITSPADNDVLVYDSATQTWQNAPQTGGSGEVNTASNLGSGEGVFASKVGADLQFKSLVAGTGVTLTPTSTTITITASGAGGAVDSVNGQTGVVVLDTDDVAEGVSNLYFTENRVLATLMAGLTLIAGGAVSAADSLLVAIGKLQKQINDLFSGKQDTLVSGTNIKTVNGTTLLGTGDLSTNAQVVEYTGTAKTLALTDINTIIDCTSGSAVTITIPPQSSVTWTADAEIHVRMSGTGTVSIAVGSGVTIPPLAAPIALSGQGAMVTLKRRSSNVWAVVGSVVGGPDVVGPASSVDNEIARFDGATGKLLKSGLKYQTSSTDTTADSVLLNGAHGLGATAPVIPSNDYNDLTDHNGYARNNNTVAATNYPPQEGTSTVPMAVHNVRFGVTYGWQFGVATRGSAPNDTTLRAYLRNEVNGSWSGWGEMWHSRRGGVVEVDTASIGYGTGSGGTITQATSKSTGVTLNKPSGQITMHPTSAINANSVASFTLTNNKIAVGDCVSVVIRSGATAGAYTTTVDAVAAGSCRISVRNMTAGNLTEALILDFVVLKGAIA